MNSVFLLQHSYEVKREHEVVDETKILGIYSSREKAERAIGKYKLLPGFNSYPNDFYIDEYELDKSFWIEGFGKDEDD